MLKTFSDNFHELLKSPDSEYFSQIYFEFMDGGDSMYGGKAPILHNEWESLSIENKSAIAEKTLNKKQLVVRYPGTYSGPREDDLRILIGLDKLEEFVCDSMMVTNYSYLLELPSLNKLTLDLYSHQDKLHDNAWIVFDAFLQANRTEFICNIDNLQKYTKDLRLLEPFVIEKENFTDDQGNMDLSFITVEYLYKNYSTSS